MKIIKLLSEYDKDTAFNDVSAVCYDFKSIFDYLNDIVKYSKQTQAVKDKINKKIKQEFEEKHDKELRHPSRQRKLPYVNPKSAMVSLGSDEEYENIPNLSEKELQDYIEKTVINFKNRITQIPKTIFSQNEKIQKTQTEELITINIGIPSIKSIIFNENLDQFQIINTCPGAGSCMIDCYTLNGNYIIQDDVFLKQTRIVNLMINNTEIFIDKAASEIYLDYINDNLFNKKYPNLAIRWNDAGDVFSKTYVEIIEDITKKLKESTLFKNKNIQIYNYLYTKSGHIVSPDNELINIIYSANNANKRQTISLIKHVKNGHTVKLSYTIPMTILSGIFKNKKWLVTPNKEVLDTISEKIYNYLKSYPDIRGEFFSSEYKKASGGLILVNDLIKLDEGNTPIYNVLVLPGDSDIAAQRKDVKNIILGFH